MTDVASLLTEAEAAQRLLMGERTLRGERQRGCIRYVRLGARKIAYRPEDIAEYVEARVTRAQPVQVPKPKARRGRGNVVSLSDYMD